MKLRHASAGYTLVEMAVVVIIVALIVAGIMRGQELLHNSRVLSVISDIEYLQTQFSAFKDKYGGYPGDMPDAQNYWGISTTGNGDGDFLIEEDAESWYSWEHLKLADMMDMGDFFGDDAGSPDYQPGVNVPPSKIRGAGYHAYNGAVHSVIENWLRFGRADSDDSINMGAGAITGLDAYMIDQKIDDGIADSGDVMAEDDDTNAANVTSCIDETASNVYIMDSDNEHCTLVFKID